MGIDLGDIVVKHPRTIADFSGKRLAIDAYNILYQYLSAIRQPDGTPLKDNEGRVTSHLQGLLTRTGNLVEVGVKPVFVFDGRPHRLKAEELAQRQARKQQAEREQTALAPATAAASEILSTTSTPEARAASVERLRHAAVVNPALQVHLKAAETALGRTGSESEVAQAVEQLRGVQATSRTKAAQTTRMDHQMAEGAKELLAALGIPTIQLEEGDGEAQGAWMAREGLVDAVVSQDFDCLLFGTPLLVRNLGVGGKRMPGMKPVEPEEIDLAESLARLGLTREQLVDAALLVGTDFHPGIKGIGAKKAVGLIRDAGSLEALLSRLDSSGPQSAVERYILEQREGLDVCDEVRGIFLQPAHTDAKVDITVRAPDVARVKAIMVDKHGFNPERVDSALAKYQAGRSKQAQQRLF